MRLDDLAGRRVVLLGLGIDVRAAVPTILQAEPSELLVVDGSLAPNPGVGNAGAVGEQSSVGELTGVEVAGHVLPVVDLEEACVRAEVMVRSPGFPRYLPELVAARERGVLMTTPVDLFLGGMPETTRVVLVTGTKGKSTTTDMIGRFAAEAGLDVGVAGNLGIPVFATGWASDAPVIVLEVSSYQASDLHHAPDVAVISSIAEDHLSWHGGLERYLSDKLRVICNDGGVAGTVVMARGEHRAREVVARLFPEIDPLLVDDLESDGSAPAHRVRNAALAAAVVELLGGEPLSTEQILAGAATSMPGRLDLCPSPAGFEGIVFVDDALASNPSATAAGLSWARTRCAEVIVILGGEDRGVSSAPLAEESALWNADPDRRLRAVALPRNGVDLATGCEIELLGSVDTLAEAVNLAAGALVESGVESGAESGGGADGRNDAMVIFSPAAPTPPGCGNWKTRSDEFRLAIEGLTGPPSVAGADPEVDQASSMSQP